MKRLWFPISTVIKRLFGLQPLDARKTESKQTDDAHAGTTSPLVEVKSPGTPISCPVASSEVPHHQSLARLEDGLSGNIEVISQISAEALQPQAPVQHLNGLNGLKDKAQTPLVVGDSHDHPSTQGTGGVPIEGSQQKWNWHFKVGRPWIAAKIPKQNSEYVYAPKKLFLG